jgi:hypothetical protein
MSLTTILTILLLILICVLPFVIINRRNKKAEKRLLQILLDHASGSNHKISQNDISGNQVIGLSESTDTLFFLKKRGGEDRILQVDLAQIERCYVNKPTRKSADGSQFTERIELRFAFCDRNKPGVVFEFYNVEADGFILSDELLVAEKWMSTVNSFLLRKARV